MKIVKAKEMSRIEKLAYDSGASEELFMENAGQNIAEAAQQFIAQHHLKPQIGLLCGRGNNAGDAYVAGRILIEGGFQVLAYAFAPFEDCSKLCQKQARRFQEAGGGIQYVTDLDSFELEGRDLLIDGILGTGFHGQVEGIFQKAIEKANDSKKPILAIDIPSGINGNTGETGGMAIRAAGTVFLGLPKTGCFLGDVWELVGQVDVRPFGLKKQFIDQAHEDFYLIDADMVRQSLPPIARVRHKYQAGYVVGIGGSHGMPGAPILASFAALRAGAGIVRLLHPEGMQAELAGAPYEIIRQGFEDPEAILKASEKAGAVFIGPGLGTSESSLKVLQTVLPKLDKPCVIDAEALTLLAAHSLPFPRQTILTPHEGEMRRLLHEDKKLSKPELFHACQAFCEEKQVTLVLKGAPTFIFHPKLPPHVCAKGDPGMATAGSGDVLTGVIAAFLSQKQDCFAAAQLGVYCHSMAGERAALAKTSRSMVASDITESLSDVFKLI